MIQYERIGVSKGFDYNKSNKSKEYMICHYWYFKDIGYIYEPHPCNGCHDLSMMVWARKGVDNRCLLFNMSKSDAIKLLNNSLLDNKGVL